jgi:Domain of unknown function (DUF4157)
MTSGMSSRAKQQHAHSSGHSGHTTSGARPAHVSRASVPSVIPPYLARKCATASAGESPFVQRTAAHADALGGECGCGTCAACAAKAQATLSMPADPLEREADAIAERVMRSPAGHAAVAGPDSRAPGSAATHTSGVLPADGGRVLDASTRQAMEPRFGAGFGSVRVHDGASAAAFAERFSARAYTVGEHVVFGAGEYQPHGDAGRRLIAHELAHVVQQRGGSHGAHVQRTADPTKFSCAAGTAGASADPFGDLDTIDRQAQGLAESMAIFGAISSILNPATGTSSFDVGYQTRFGTPQQVGTRFRNRFTGALRATEEQAAQEEISVIGDRFQRMRDFLAGSIRYKCRAVGVNFTLGGCTGRCEVDDFARSCVPTDQRTIGICPDFWGLAGDDQRAGVLIHEAAHMRLDFGAHLTGNRVQRGRNPECYTSMVADTFGFAPVDPRCPPI